MNLLNQFIAEQSELSFRFGYTDCCSTCNNWVKLKTTVSPLEEFGRPITQEDAKDWLNEENLLKAVSSVMQKTNFARTKTPKIGDIGLIVIDPQTIAMAIKTEAFWFTRNESGLIAKPFETVCLRAWSIN